MAGRLAVVASDVPQRRSAGGHHGDAIGFRRQRLFPLQAIGPAFGR
jgi:hypothetical protein